MENPDVIFRVDMDADHFSPLAAVHALWKRGPAFNQPIRIGQFGWLGVHGFTLLSQTAKHEDRQKRRQKTEFHWTHLNTLYCAHDPSMRTADVAELFFGGGGCRGDHGFGFGCPGSAGAGATVTQCVRHCRWDETLSAKRELSGMSRLVG